MMLLALHFAICVVPTVATPSSLECVIFIYLIGRLLVEFKECKDLLTSEDRKMKLRRLKNYLRYISQSIINKDNLVNNNNNNNTRIIILEMKQQQ